MRSGSRPSREGTRLLFAVVRSVLQVWCVQLMDNRRTSNKARRETSQEEDTYNEPETNSWPQQGGGFRWSCFRLVFWGDPVWYRMIYPYRSWYHITHHAISRDTIYRDVASISRILGTDVEISRYRTCPVETFLDTEHSYEHQVTIRQGRYWRTVKEFPRVELPSGVRSAIIYSTGRSITNDGLISFFFGKSYGH